MTHNTNKNTRSCHGGNDDYRTPRNPRTILMFING